MSIISGDRWVKMRSGERKWCFQTLSSLLHLSFRPKR